MIKLFIYPEAKKHVHDQHPIYYNTVPFSVEGIKKHCIVTTNPNEADLFYMGQFSDGSTDNELNRDWKYLKQYTDKHVCDIEGDWPNRRPPEFLRYCKITINGLDKDWEYPNAFVRPTFSFLLLKLAKELLLPEFNYNKYNSFGFMGFPEPFGIRTTLSHIFSKNAGNGLLGEVILNHQWLAPTETDDEKSIKYQKFMQKHNLALCPRGMGRDSVRFFEACYYGRCPVVIGNNILFEQKIIDSMDFCYFISTHNLTIQSLMYKLMCIQNEKPEVIIEKGKRAQQFFTVVKKYFNDPTEFFLASKYIHV